jgi:hypothetical protein
MKTATTKRKTTSGEATPCPSDAVVVRLVLARDEAKKAKAALVRASETLGRCDGHNHDEGPCYVNNTKELCDICQVKVPLWEQYQRAANLAGAALRAVMKHGRELIG